MQRRLHIASVCRTLPNPDDPATGIYVLNRLGAMSRYADVTILQPVPYVPLVRPLPVWARAERRTFRGAEIRIVPMPYIPRVLKSLDGWWLERAIAPVLRQLKAERGLDLIDAHFGYPDGVGCVSVAQQLGVPAFITLRGLENEYLKKPIIGEQLKRALRAARGAVCVSHSLRDLAIAEAGVDPAHIVTIHNGVDTTVFKRGERAAARARLGLGTSQPLIVAVGNLIHRKRHHVLAEAFARVRRTRPDAMLAILGGESVEPDYPPRLAARIRELGLTDAVKFVGNVAPPEVATWLQAADLFALATAREGCCNAILEALAVGVPVVTTPVGDNARFVREGHNGHLVPVDAVPELAQALERALATHEWPAGDIAAAMQVEQWDGVAQDVMAFIAARLADTTNGAAPVRLDAVHSGAQSGSTRGG